MDNKNKQKQATKFECTKCDFICFKKSNYEKHLLTQKHKRITQSNDLMPKNAKKYLCICGCEYKYASGLSKHKKKCPSLTNKDISITSNKDSSNDKLVEYLMKENSELKKMLVEHCSVTNNTNNTNNNHFNINVFLNEECKDAMNLTDFIDSIQLSIEDVANIGEKGQTSGFAKILVDKLSALDLYKRPLHCSDAKRETLYVKDNDMWDKEPHDRPRIKQVIDHISMKGIQRVPELDLPNDKMTTTISEIVNTPINHKKIISTVAKEVKI